MDEVQIKRSPVTTIFIAIIAFLLGGLIVFIWQNFDSLTTISSTPDDSSTEMTTNTDDSVVSSTDDTTPTDDADTEVVVKPAYRIDLSASSYLWLSEAEDKGALGRLAYQDGDNEHVLSEKIFISHPDVRGVAYASTEQGHVYVMENGFGDGGVFEKFTYYVDTNAQRVVEVKETQDTMTFMHPRGIAVAVKLNQEKICKPAPATLTGVTGKSTIKGILVNGFEVGMTQGEEVLNCGVPGLGDDLCDCRPYPFVEFIGMDPTLTFAYVQVQTDNSGEIETLSEIYKISMLNGETISVTNAGQFDVLDVGDIKPVRLRVN